MINLDILREELSYDPATGKICWRVKKNSFGGQVHPGTVAGTVGDQGYIKINTQGRVLRAHHLACLLMTGTMPVGDMDHINGDRADNRWSNLRRVTRRQNQMNQGIRTDNKSGCKGVSRRADTGKWHARITVEGKIILLGNYDDIEDAVKARRAAEAIHFGAFAASPRPSHTLAQAA